MLELPVRVVDEDGKPVAKAKITPWALRSSQGHGHWQQNDKRAQQGPQKVLTDDDGFATVEYPQLRDVQEAVRTLAVSLQVDHPDFAFADDLHVDVPLESEPPYLIELTKGGSVTVRPMDDGSPTTDEVFALWSDGRSWLPGAALKKLDDGSLELSAIPSGDNSVLLVKLDGERATHFSKIVDFKVTAGERSTIDVELKPAAHIKGALSASVPRPVRNGRIKVWTLDPLTGQHNRVRWFTWAPVQPDGTFFLDWPADEPVQLLALCDGYMAESGKAPDVVEPPPDPKIDPYIRPQVFPVGNHRIEVAMVPLARCVAQAIDGDTQAIAGVKVVSWPNVGWWNSGSQVYCSPLERGELVLRGREYESSLDKTIPPPFQAETDGQGRAILELPAGERQLTVNSDVYELPAFLGRRDVKVMLDPNEVVETVLRLQPRGTEKLGEWDKLAGVVFGCSTREGRRICALPGVQEKIDDITKRFREAKDQRDPTLLSEAYTTVAEAFVGVGDLEEAAKWREKANEQMAKLGSAQ
jgi:hypothetical protein